MRSSKTASTQTLTPQPRRRLESAYLLLGYPELGMESLPMASCIFGRSFISTKSYFCPTLASSSSFVLGLQLAGGDAVDNLALRTGHDSGRTLHAIFFTYRLESTISGYGPGHCLSSGVFGETCVVRSAIDAQGALRLFAKRSS